MMESKIPEQQGLDRAWLMWAPSIQNKLYYYVINIEPELLNHLFPCYLHKIDKTATFDMDTVYQMFVCFLHRGHHNKAMATARSWLCSHVMWTDKRQRASFDKGSEDKGHCKSGRQWRMVWGKKPNDALPTKPSVVSSEKILLTGYRQTDRPTDRQPLLKHD